MTRIQLANNSVTIKSTELVEIINQFRQLEGNRKELRHNDFMTKIKKELEVLQSLGLSNQRNISLVEYRDKKGELRPCFELNRDGMLQMLNSESPLVRYKTIEYINKLEQQIKDPITTYLNMSEEDKAIAYFTELKKTKQLQTEKEIIQIEKDNLVHDDKTFTVSELASELGFSSAKALNQELANKKIQYKVNGTWKLYGKYSGLGYTITKSERVNNKTVYYTRWTGVGRDFLVNKVFNDR